MNYLIKITSIFILILLICMPAAYAKGAHSAHVSHSAHTSGKTTISGAKTYTAPKNFTSKYNTSNIKTNKIQEASNYHSYSSTNVFTPNFWTAMWAFQCMHDNTEKVTEQDIAKELEERGYTQEEIDEILAEGRESQTENKVDVDADTWIIAAIVGLLLLFLVIMIAMCM